MKVLVGRRQRVERGDQRGQVLARFDGAEGEHVAARRRPDAGRSPRPSLPLGGRRAQAVRHDHDPIRLDGERLLDLVGHEPAHRMHPGAPLHGSGDERRVLEGVGRAQFGNWTRGEVVDRQHFGGVPGGGHDEVRPVHDLTWTGQPFRRRHVRAEPCGADESSRNRRPDDRAPRRGRARRKRPRPRQVTANAAMSTSSRCASRETSASVNRPTPVWASISDVASRARRSGSVNTDRAGPFDGSGAATKRTEPDQRCEAQVSRSAETCRPRPW